MKKLSAALLKPQAPRLKTGTSQQKSSPLPEATKAKGCDADELTSQGNASPIPKAEACDLKEEAGASDLTAVQKGHEPVVTADAATAKGAAPGERPRQRSGLAKEHSTGAAAKKAASGQQAQPAGGRVSQGGLPRSSLGTAPPRTGDEIWGLNMQLGKLVEQLADPEDSKPGRRKQKSPKLAEIAHQCWGGTYGGKLDKDYAYLDVKQPPAPKYEPPLFLEDASMADDDGNSDEDVLRRRSSETTAAKDKSAEEQPLVAEASYRSSLGTSAGTAAPATARGGKSAVPAAGPAGRRAAPAPAKKPSAGPAAAARGPIVAAVEATNKAERGLAGSDEVLDAVAGAADGDQRDVAERKADKDSLPAPRRASRKTKAGAAEPVSKGAQARPAAARKTGRGGVAATLANTADVGAEDQGLHGAAIDLAPSDNAAAPAHGAAASGRIRRSHVTTVTAFGSTISKPPPSSCAAAVTADAMEDAMSLGDAAGAGPTASKRARDGVVTVDDKLRMNKASRTEQQQQKEIENQRRHNAELELKCREQVEQNKQLHSDVAAAEKRASTAEAERKRATTENAMLQRDIEKLKADLKDRDEKIANLKDENKQLRTENERLKQRNRAVEQWGADLKQMVTQQNEKLKAI